MNTTDKTKNLIEIIKRLDFYINTTNTKSTILLTYCSAFLAGITLKHIEVISFVNGNGAKTAIGIMIAFATITVILAILTCLISIFPFTKSGAINTLGESVIFYNDISRHTDQEYIKKIKDLEDQNFLEDLATQAHTLAHTLTKKLRLLKFAFNIVLYLNIPLYLIALIIISLDSIEKLPC